MGETHHDNGEELIDKIYKFIKKNLILWIVVMAGIFIVCVLTKCLNSEPLPLPPNIDTNDSNTSKPIKDSSEFVNNWNNQIYKLKIDNTHLKINFDKYKLGVEPQKELDRFLDFNQSKIRSLKEKLENSKFKFKYKPILSWIEMKQNIKYVIQKDEMDSRQLMEFTASIANPPDVFSNNTIDKVAQLNEFCYYFDINKNKLYRDGFTRNINDCEQIQEILNVDGINFDLLNGTDNAKLLKKQ
jgi:hypothetical protein